MDIFKTITTAVVIFCLGQWVLEVFIKPSIKLRNVIGEISAFLLKWNHKLHNNGNDGSSIDSIYNTTRYGISLSSKELAGRLMAKANGIMVFQLARIIFNLPTEEKIREAAQYLNLISSKVAINKPEIVISELKTIGDCLGIPTLYSDPVIIKKVKKWKVLIFLLVVVAIVSLLFYFSQDKQPVKVKIDEPVKVVHSESKKAEKNISKASVPSEIRGDK